LSNITLLSIVFLLSFFFVGHKDLIKYLLFFGIVTLPISFDYTFLVLPSENHVGWADGIMVTLSDLFFLFLFIAGKMKTPRETSHEMKALFIFPISLFLVACIFSVPGAIWRRFSYFEIVQFCKIVFLYYYVPMTVLKNKEDIRFVYLSLLAALFLQSILAIVQFYFQDYYNFLHTGSNVRLTWFGNYIRSQGTVGQPNGFAAFIIPILLLNQMILSSEKRRKFLYKNIWILGLIALVFSFSRASWLAFIFSTFLLLLAKKKGDRLVANIFPLIALGGITLFFYDFWSARIMTSDQGSLQDRWYLMRIAFEIIRKNFFFGVGINNYWFAMNHYIPQNYDWPFIYMVHNVFLLVFAETGIIGFIAIILLFVVPIIKTLRFARTGNFGLSEYSLWLSASFIAIAINNFVDLTWASSILNSLYFFLLGLANVILNLGNRKYSES